VTKTLLTKFVYNNNVHSTINISFFFAIYGFYFNILSSVKDDRLKNEVPITRKKIKKFENEGKKLKNDGGIPSSSRKRDIIKIILPYTSL
jgi:hypothetical protein